MWTRGEGFKKAKNYVDIINGGPLLSYADHSGLKRICSDYQCRRAFISLMQGQGRGWLQFATIPTQPLAEKHVLWELPDMMSASKGWTGVLEKRT